MAWTWERNTEMMTPLQPSNRGRIAVLAFGTYGDVLPIAVVTAELAKSKQNCAITFITHSAHERIHGEKLSTKEKCVDKDFEVVITVSGKTTAAGVCFYPISTAPVALRPDTAVSANSERQSSDTGILEEISATSWKDSLEHQHREQCLSAVEHIFHEQQEEGQDFIIFNFFALEGWHLAELFCVPCAVAAPYVVPYSAPASFERQFRAVQPLLYGRLCDAQVGEVGWVEVMHWMWPLFTDRWTQWRSSSLHLSTCPLTDPVTELPIVQDWPQAPPLLYGFSQEVVECPGYWPRSIHVCGFWYPPAEWAMESKNARHCIEDPRKHLDSETSSNPLPWKLLDFLSQNIEVDKLPIFIGLSSIGSAVVGPPCSMGCLTNPRNFLKIILKVLEAADRRAILFTGSHAPLDSTILAVAKDTEFMNRNRLAHLDECTPFKEFELLKDGIILGNGQLFCCSGFVPYNWLFPKCAMVVHHGGSWNASSKSGLWWSLLLRASSCLGNLRSYVFEPLNVKVELQALCKTSEQVFSGTTAAALRAGIPQIICPFVLDQFYWAERMAWIGVAPQPLKPIHLFASDDDKEFMESVSTLLNTVIEASKTEMRACAAGMGQEDGAGNFVQIISEQLLSSRSHFLEC